MSLIKNLIKEKDQARDQIDDATEKEDGTKVRPVVKSALDLQRLKLEKLMKNPVSYLN